MIRRSGEGVTLLRSTSVGATEGARVVAPTTGVLCATDWAIPGEAVMFASSASPCAGRVLLGEETRTTIGVRIGAPRI